MVVGKSYENSVPPLFALRLFPHFRRSHPAKKRESAGEPRNTGARRISSLKGIGHIRVNPVISLKHPIFFLVGIVGCKRKLKPS